MDSTQHKKDGSRAERNGSNDSNASTRNPVNFRSALNSGNGEFLCRDDLLTLKYLRPLLLLLSIWQLCNLRQLEATFSGSYVCSLPLCAKSGCHHLEQLVQ